MDIVVVGHVDIGDTLGPLLATRMFTHTLISIAEKQKQEMTEVLIQQPIPFPISSRREDLIQPAIIKSVRNDPHKKQQEKRREKNYKVNYKKR